MEIAVPQSHTQSEAFFRLSVVSRDMLARALGEPLILNDCIQALGNIVWKQPLATDKSFWVLTSLNFSSVQALSAIDEARPGIQTIECRQVPG